MILFHILLNEEEEVLNEDELDDEEIEEAMEKLERFRDHMDKKMRDQIDRKVQVAEIY